MEGKKGSIKEATEVVNNWRMKSLRLGFGVW